MNDLGGAPVVGSGRSDSRHGSASSAVHDSAIRWRRERTREILQTTVARERRIEGFRRGQAAHRIGALIVGGGGVAGRPLPLTRFSRVLLPVFIARHANLNTPCVVCPVVASHNPRWPIEGS